MTTLEKRTAPVDPATKMQSSSLAVDLTHNSISMRLPRQLFKRVLLLSAHVLYAGSSCMPSSPEESVISAHLAAHVLLQDVEWAGVVRSSESAERAHVHPDPHERETLPQRAWLSPGTVLLVSEREKVRLRKRLGHWTLMPPHGYWYQHSRGIKD